MPESYFILSSPPHSEANVTELAPLFELTPAEARLKLNYPASTVWFAGEDLAQLQATGKSLQARGANVRLIKGRSVTALSKRHRFRRFAFDETCMQCWVDKTRKIDIPYSWTVQVMTCRPMQTETYERQTLRQTIKSANRNKSIRQEAKSSLSSIREVVDERFVDLYFYEIPKVHRFTAQPGDTDFSGLGSAMKHSVNENTAELIKQISDRFSNVKHLRAMENLPAPRATVLGKRSLRSILDEIEPGLGDIDPYDLISRLCFLAGA